MYLQDKLAPKHHLAYLNFLHFQISRCVQPSLTRYVIAAFPSPCKHWLSSGRQRETLGRRCHLWRWEAPWLPSGYLWVLTCSLTEVDALGEVAGMTVAALEWSCLEKGAIPGVEALGRKPGVAVFTGTAQDPVLVATVCGKNRAWSHRAFFINCL